jgi:hypothetical protein
MAWSLSRARSGFSIGSMRCIAWSRPEVPRPGGALSGDPRPGAARELES